MKPISNRQTKPTVTTVLTYGTLLLPLGILLYSASVSDVGIVRAEAHPENLAKSALSTPQEASTLRSAPQIRSASEAGVCRMVPNLALTTIDGRAKPLHSFVGEKGLVVAMVSSTCPVSQKMAPALARAEQTAKAAGLGFLYVAVTPTDSVSELQAMAKSSGWRGAITKDTEGTLLHALNPASTTEVFVLDAARTIIYRGAVSDQYGPTWAKDQPTKEYLTSAIRAVGRGEIPAVIATTAPGCALEKPSKPKELNAVTYHNRISRIVQENCVECHRSGGIAPFTLENYDAVVAHAGMIRQVVQEGQMPPWFAEPASDKTHSPWANDRSLSPKDKSDLLQWLAGEKPKGDPADAPAPKKFAESGWNIGKPDAIFAFAKPVKVKAEGTMPYQIVDVPTNFTQDTWVDGIEVQPGDRSVVHHVLVFVRKPGESARGDMDERGGFFGAYVPGFSTLDYPAGFAKKIPAGSVLRFQMHYTPNGKATEDVTRIGFRIAKTPPKHEVKVAGIANILLRIPPGAENHPEKATIPVPADVKVLAFLPHMHVRAKAARYELVTPDKKRTTLLNVPRYDFNWQLYYELKEPLSVPKGSRIEFTGWFDNSAKNPANPDPTKLVRWGPQTYDEMLLGYVEYYIPGPLEAEGGLQRGGRIGEALRERFGSRGNGSDSGQNIENLFRRLDKNGDGRLSRDELPRESLFNQLDANKDGFVTLEEAKKRFSGGR